MEPGVPPQLRRSSSDAANLLGRYHLGRLLGRGSFAKVYEARSLADHSTVAVKVIDKSKTHAAMEPRVISEVAAMRRLHDHPNILKIHEVMATKSKIYLVMEFASGGELFAKLRRVRRFGEPAARRYFQQLVSALHFCHQKGVAHRDVKPQNVLLDKDGNLKVSDFGLSALPEQLKDGLLRTSCGTPAYTAPEVACRRGGGYDGTKADAWSCGIMLFVLLAGALPFDDSNLAAMFKKIHRRDYEFPACIPKGARNLIYKLLDPNPNSRMSIETVMESSWFKKSLKLTPQSSLLPEAAKMDGAAGVMNAFDIISLSPGLDLSGLLEASQKQEKRFTSVAPVENVLGKVKEIGGRLGYRVEEGKGGTLGLGKGVLVVLVEVLEVAQSLLLVEVKVVGGGMDFDWGDIKSGLEDIVLSWHNNPI